MKIETHNINDIKIAEITSDETIITTSQDGLDLLGNLYYQGFDRIVLNEKNITPQQNVANIKNRNKETSGTNRQTTKTKATEENS